MNYHNDEWITNKLKEHYEEAKNFFAEENIVGIFVQGSQNYGLDYEKSDLDTKLIVTPPLTDLIYNNKPVSTTHVRDNNEHIDFKDIRLYIDCFKKQNLNFLEILFTPYKIVNPMYKSAWDMLVNNRENIAHMNQVRSVKSMVGVALEKYHALQHPYPSKLDILAKHGYDPKQLHHLLRVEDYLERYIAGETYESCLQPTDPVYLLQVKKGLYNEADAIAEANRALERIKSMEQDFLLTHESSEDELAIKILQEVQTIIMKKSIRREIENETN